MSTPAAAQASVTSRYATLTRRDTDDPGWGCRRRQVGPSAGPRRSPPPAPPPGAGPPVGRRANPDAEGHAHEGYGGCTADDSFHQLLDDEWDEDQEVDLPQWDGIHDRLTVYRRR